MPGGLLPVEAPLNGHRAVFVDGKLPLTVGTPIDRVEHLALATLVGIRRCERLQAAADTSVLRHRSLDIRLLELRLIIVYVAQLHHHPRISDVVLVVVVVFALRNHIILVTYSRFSKIEKNHLEFKFLLF